MSDRDYRDPDPRWWEWAWYGLEAIVLTALERGRRLMWRTGCVRHWGNDR